MKPFRRMVFVVNAGKSGADGLTAILAKRAEAQGVAVSISRDYPVAEGLLADQDLCCVVGGDGTLLSVVAESVRWQTPVFGINRGKLGFLATYSEEEVLAAFEGLLAGNCRLEQRSVLFCTNAQGKRCLGLNDLVIKSEDGGRMIGLRVVSGDDLVTDYYCDGLIFCTPTGSTAYNLSAGGPIVMPASEVFLMTPICPHTLTNRSVVFPRASRLSIHLVESRGEPVLTVDGGQRLTGAASFPLELGVASETFPLLQSPDYSHLRILRNKLRWGRSDPHGTRSLSGFPPTDS